MAEAKARMSYVEAQNWMAYISQNGPLNPGLRLELGIAQLRYTMHRLVGHDLKLTDLLPQRAPPSEEPVATAQDIMAVLNFARS